MWIVLNLIKVAQFILKLSSKLSHLIDPILIPYWTGGQVKTDNQGRTLINESHYQHTKYRERTHFITVPGTNHTVVNPTDGLTVLIGTGSPRQTVIGSDSKLDGSGPVKIYPGYDDGRSAPQQTVYAKEGGLTVLIGTGGPTQTVHQVASTGCVVLGPGCQPVGKFYFKMIQTKLITSIKLCPYLLWEDCWIDCGNFGG